MTQHRSFKKLVRARMRRTGESYTAALAQLQRSAPPSRPVNRGGAGMYPFERFTERAKKVLTLAQNEAESAGHTYIGTEHLLLALLREEEGLARRTLDALGVDLGRARDAIQTLLSRLPQRATSLTIPTSRVKKVIEIAFEEARRMGHSFVGTEHLLFGLLIEGEGVAARALADLGVTLEKVRAEVDRLLEAAVTEPTTPDQPRPRPAGGLPMAPDLRELMLRAHTRAANGGSSAVGLDHILQAVGPVGVAALERMLDLRRLVARKEQAIAAQDYEAAGQLRMEEKGAAEALERALAAWRTELEPPAKEDTRTA